MRFGARAASLITRTVFFGLALWFCLPAAEAQQDLSLGEIARKNRETKPDHDTTPPDIKKLIDDMASAAEGSADEGQYQREIQELIAQQKFAALDQQAHEARVTKARFSGGDWKLHAFYEIVSTPPSGKKASDYEWMKHLTVLTRWATERPQSITARVALAEAYIGWGWAARGHGFANTVTNQGQASIERRAAEAKKILNDAGGLPEKCPYWFQAMQHVALIEGWDKARARALLEQAVSFAPDYHHFYREYANFILPRWYGREGEAEAFAESLASSAPGTQADFLYFEIATMVHCSCGEQHELRMSWSRIKQGYAAMEQLYGTSTLKMNRYAYLAFLAKDHETAHDLMAKIGTTWDEKTWGTRQSFNLAQAWASANATPQVTVQTAR